MKKKKKKYILVIPKITGRENQFCFEQPLVKNASIFEIFLRGGKVRPQSLILRGGIIFFSLFLLTVGTRQVRYGY